MYNDTHGYGNYCRGGPIGTGKTGPVLQGFVFVMHCFWLYTVPQEDCNGFNADGSAANSESCNKKFERGTQGKLTLEKK